MSGKQQGSGMAMRITRAARARRFVAFLLAFAMATELVPAQGLRGIVLADPVDGSAEPETPASSEPFDLSNNTTLDTPSSDQMTPFVSVNGRAIKCSEDLAKVIPSQAPNGSEQIKPPITSVTVDPDGVGVGEPVSLAVGTDYTLSYGDNNSTGNGGTVTIAGTGSYTGSITLTFTISDGAQQLEAPVVATNLPFRGDDQVIAIADTSYYTFQWADGQESSGEDLGVRVTNTTGDGGAVVSSVVTAKNAGTYENLVVARINDAVVYKATEEGNSGNPTGYGWKTDNESDDSPNTNDLPIAWTITKADISTLDASAFAFAEATYNGGAQTPAVTLTLPNATSPVENESGQNYTVFYGEGNVNATTDDTKASALVFANPAGNLVNGKQLSFDIAPFPLSDENKAQVSLTSDGGELHILHDGASYTPTPTVKAKLDGAAWTELDANTDYDVAYYATVEQPAPQEEPSSGVVRVASGDSLAEGAQDVGVYAVRVTGKGNYRNSAADVLFSIDANEVATLKSAVDDARSLLESVSYASSSEQKPYYQSIVVGGQDQLSTEPVPDGAKFYKGTANAKAAADAQLQSAIDTAAALYEVSSDGTACAVSGTSAAAINEAIEALKTARATYEGQDNAHIGTAVFDEVTIPVPVSGLTYNGSEQMGVAGGTGYMLSSNDATIKPQSLGDALDPQAAGSGDAVATNAGTYAVTATLNDGYRWPGNGNDVYDPKALEFTIGTADIGVVEVGSFEDPTYDGTEKTISPTFTIGDHTLVEGADYTASFEGVDGADTIVAGQKTMTITATGSNFTNGTTKTVSYTVRPLTLTKAMVRVEDAGVVYTGSEIDLSSAQLVVRKVDADNTPVGNALTRDTDYEVSYGDYDHTDAGASLAVVTGKGNYTGAVTVPFSIHPKDLSNAEASGVQIAEIGIQAYEEDAAGRPVAKEPSLVVTDTKRGESGVVLMAHTDDVPGDYTVSYANNTAQTTAEFKATATITGRGNYTGSQTATFEIGPWDVAEIVKNGSHTGYKTLAEAAAAAESGDTITLLKPIELSAAVGLPGESASAKDITLDLNGTTATSLGTAFELASGSLAIVNGRTGDAEEGSIVQPTTAATEPLFKVTGGTLAVGGGTSGKVALKARENVVDARQGNVTLDANATLKSETSVAVKLDTSGTFTMTGGEVTCQDDAVVLGAGTSGNISGGVVASTGEGNGAVALTSRATSLSVTGGSITANRGSALSVGAGAATVTAGSITNDVGSANPVVRAAGSGATITFGTSDAESQGAGPGLAGPCGIAAQNGAKVTFASGTLKLTGTYGDETPATPFVPDENASTDVTVTGGLFSHVVDTDLVSPDDAYTPVPGDPSVAEIQIGETPATEVMGRPGTIMRVDVTDNERHELIYTGAQRAPQYEVTGRIGSIDATPAPVAQVEVGEGVLDSRPNFAVSYRKLQNDSWTPIDASEVVEIGEYQIVVTGQNRYVGLQADTFSIVREGIDATSIDVEAIDGATYDGSAVRPEPVVTYGEGASARTLAKDTDYMLSYYATQDGVAAGEALTEGPTEVGTYAVRITGAGNYDPASYRDVSFEIVPKSIAGEEITATRGELTYTGAAQEPTLTVTDTSIAGSGADEGKALTQGVDYGVTYYRAENETATGDALEAAPTAAGSYVARLTGTGNYNPATHKDVVFTIGKRVLADAMVTLDATEFTYNKSAQAPAVTVSDPLAGASPEDEPQQAIVGSDYEVSYWQTVAGADPTRLDGAPKDAGTYQVQVSAKEDGNYTGEVTKDFEIKKFTVTQDNVEVTIHAQTYTASKIELAPQNMTAVVTLVPATAADAEAGTEATDAVTEELAATDFSVENTGENLTVAQGGTVTLRGVEESHNFAFDASGVTAGFDIVAAPFTVALASNADAKVTYKAQPYEPAVTVKVGGTTVPADKGYTVSYSHNTNVGYATAIVTGNTNLQPGPATVSFQIVPYPIKFHAATALVKALNSATFTPDGGGRLMFTYDGTDAMGFAAADSLAGFAVQKADGTSVTLAEVLKLAGNIKEAGVGDTFKLTISADENYELVKVTGGGEDPAAEVETKYDSVDIDWGIQAQDLGDQSIVATIAANGTYAHGEPVGPALTVTQTFPEGVTDGQGNASKQLVEGTDFDVTYARQLTPGTAATDTEPEVPATYGTPTADKPTEAGTYQVTMTGKGNYTGTRQLSWTIDPVSLADDPAATVTLATSSVVYNGTNRATTATATGENGNVTVTLGETVVKPADYTVSIAPTVEPGVETPAPTGEAKDAGAYTVTVTGSGNVVGTATADFTITPKPIALTALVATNPVFQGGTAQEGVTLDLADQLAPADVPPAAPAPETPAAPIVTLAVPDGSGATVATDGSKVTATNAGDYVVTATVASDNYVWGEATEGAVAQRDESDQRKATIGFSITPKPLQLSSLVAVAGLVYNGQPQTGVTFQPSAGAVVEQGEGAPAVVSFEVATPQGEGEEPATADSSQATDAGNYVATATIVDPNYLWADAGETETPAATKTGATTATIPFAIAKRDIATALAGVEGSAAATVAAGELTYNGSAREPQLTVTLDGADFLADHYDVSYVAVAGTGSDATETPIDGAPVAAGSYKAVVTAKADSTNYAGSVTSDVFTVAKRTLDANHAKVVVDPASYDYTGTAVPVDPKVYYYADGIPSAPETPAGTDPGDADAPAETGELLAPADYTLSFAKTGAAEAGEGAPSEVGTYVVTATGKGNYQGTVSAQMAVELVSAKELAAAIVAAKAEADEVKVSADGVTYADASGKPAYLAPGDPYVTSATQLDALKAEIARAEALIAPGNGYTAANLTDEAVELAEALSDLKGATTAAEAVAIMAGTQYTSLKQAVGEAKGTSYITLLKNVADGEGIVVAEGAGLNLTIDLGGNSYAADTRLAGSTGTENQVFQLLKGNSVKFVNGTITSGSARMLVQNYANLTFENVTLDARNLEHYRTNADGTQGDRRDTYALSNNNGTVLVTGATNIYASTKAFPEGSALDNYAFDVFDWQASYPDGAQVTVDTTGTIKGTVELGVHSSTPAGANAKSTLTVRGGSFEGALVDNARFADADVNVYPGATFTSELPRRWAAKGHYVTTQAADANVAPLAAGDGPTLWTVAPLQTVDAPTPVAGLVYSGSEQTGATLGDHVSQVAGTTEQPSVLKATAVGSYQAVVEPDYGYYWADSAEGGYDVAPRVVDWGIDKASVAVPAVSDDVTYDGGAHTGVTLATGAAYALDEAATNTASATDVGAYSVTLKLDDAANYRWSDGEELGTRTFAWKIVPRDIATTEGIVVSQPADATYDGAAQTPAVTVTDGTKTLAPVTGTGAAATGDYTLVYGNNTNATTADAPATVTVTGHGNYQGVVARSFAIAPYDLSANAAKVTVVAPERDYVGTPVELSKAELSATVSDVKKADGTDGYKLADADYDLFFANNTNAGDASVVVSGKGNFTGAAGGTFKIKGIPLSAANTTVALKDPAQVPTFDGSAQEPELVVTYGTGEGVRALGKDVDYSVSYANNTNATTSQSPASATITGMGNYSGTAGTTFAIAPKSLAAPTVAVANPKAVTYTGSPVTLDDVAGLVVTDGQTTLAKDVDYTVALPTTGNLTDAGDVELTITGTGNYQGAYAGTTKAKLVIEPATLTADNVAAIADQTLLSAGSAVEPAPTVTFGSRTLTKAANALATGDYTVNYANNTQIGDATVTVTGKGNFAGSATVGFKIVAADASSLEELVRQAQELLDATVPSGTSGADVYSDTYWATEGALGSMRASLAAAKAVVEGGASSTMEINISKEALTSALSTFAAARKPGQRTRLTGVDELAEALEAAKSDYEHSQGQVSEQNGRDFASDEVWVTQAAREALKGVVDSAERVLEAAEGGKIWTDAALLGNLTPQQLVDATRTAVVQAKNAFDATKRLGSKGMKISLDSAAASVDPKTFVYDGTAKEPAVSVTLGGVVVPEHNADGSANYTVSYTNNVNVGTDQAYAIVSGAGDNYQGSVYATFSIAKGTVSRVSAIPNQVVADGRPVTPAVEVFDTAGNVLVEGRDYTAAFADNTEVGTAKVTVAGTGNYAGGASAAFKIVAPANRAVLKSLVAAAATDLNDTVTSTTGVEVPTDADWAPALQKQALTNATVAAQVAIEDENAGAETISEAIAELTMALNDFDRVKRPGALQPRLRARAHVEDYDWQSWETVGTTSVLFGTTGQAKRLEALEFQLQGTASYGGSVVVQAHLQGIGWDGRSTRASSASGAVGSTLVGTTHEARRLEAIRLSLAGAVSSHYALKYRAHVQGIGWLGWVDEGEVAGTTGQSRRLEALEVRFVEK